jgi:hypothetical protein
METPILMTAENYVKSRDGDKTQTRRLNGLWEINKNPDDWEVISILKDRVVFRNKNLFTTKTVKFPFGGPGDWLWFKEPFKLIGMNIMQIPQRQVTALYLNDNFVNSITLTPNEHKKMLKWRPILNHNMSSLFMFKSLARLWAVNTDVRVGRLQDIDWVDAIKEGIKDPRRAKKRLDPQIGCVAQFKDLWNSINGDRMPWEKNPWVFPYTYKVGEK